MIAKTTNNSSFREWAIGILSTVVTIILFVLGILWNEFVTVREKVNDRGALLEANRERSIRNNREIQDLRRQVEALQKRHK